MINGIPVKIARETEQGTDCETVYFATFRKCPALAGMVRGISKLETDAKKAERLRQIAEERLAMAAAGEVEAAGSELDAANTRSLDAQDAVMSAFAQFLEEGFKAAGYDAENATRIAASIPMDKFGEIVTKAKVGSGFCDFFSEPTRSGGR